MKKILYIFLLLLSAKGYCQLADSTTGIQLRNYYFKKDIQILSPHSQLMPPMMGDIHFGNNTTHRNYVLSSNIFTRFFFGNETFSRVLADFHLETDIRILRDNSKSPKYNGNEIPWDNSLGVRTPSIKPGVTFYLNLFNKPAKETMLQSVMNDKVVKNRYFSIKLFHHSNGQDGPHSKEYLKEIVESRYFYKKGKRNNILDTDIFNSDFNVYNGNFAVDLLAEPALDFIKNTYNVESEKKYHQIQSYHIGFESAILIGEKLLKGNYGLQKLNFKWQRVRIDRVKKDELNFEKNRWILNTSIAVNKINNSNLLTRINTELVFQFNPFFKEKPYFKNNNVSFFISGGWKGQDDYNIYFQDSFLFLKSGLALGLKADQSKKFLQMENRFFH